MATDVCQNLSLQAELADGFAIETRLLRSSGRSKFYVFHTKGIERPGNGNFGFGVKESVGKLLSLYARVRW